MALTVKIEPNEFKTVAGRAGVGFEISFKSEREAQQFQQRFSSFLACLDLRHRRARPAQSAAAGPGRAILAAPPVRNSLAARASAKASARHPVL